MALRDRPVLVAPDSFKGTMSAPAVAEAIARGLERAGLRADRCPVADGGEGTMGVLLERLGGELLEAQASDPLGRAITASFARLGDGATALVEVAGRQRPLSRRPRGARRRGDLERRPPAS